MPDGSVSWSVAKTFVKFTQLVCDILLIKIYWFVFCVCIFRICKCVNPVTPYADHLSEGSLKMLSFNKVNKVSLVLKYRLTMTLVSTRSICSWDDFIGNLQT